jgi:PAS domain S-box-containing protein
MAKANAQTPERAESDPLRELKLTCMSNLLSATEERVYFKDLLSRFLLISAGWLATYAPGRAAEELIGKTDFDVFSYEHAAVALKDEQQVIRTGQPIVGKLERETYKDRPDAWVSTTKMPLRDERGRIIGTFGISRDVTAQIKAENALAMAHRPGRPPAAGARLAAAAGKRRGHRGSPCSAAPVGAHLRASAAELHGTPPRPAGCRPIVERPAAQPPGATLEPLPGARNGRLGDHYGNAADHPREGIVVGTHESHAACGINSQGKAAAS